MPITITLSDDDATELVRCIEGYTDDLATLGADDDDREALARLERMKQSILHPVKPNDWRTYTRQLLIEASAPGGIGEHEFTRDGGWRDRAKLALSICTDDEHPAGELNPQNGLMWLQIMGRMFMVKHIAGSDSAANEAMRLDPTLALIDTAGPLRLLARKDDKGIKL